MRNEATSVRTVAVAVLLGACFSGCGESQEMAGTRAEQASSSAAIGQEHKETGKVATPQQASRDSFAYQFQPAADLEDSEVRFLSVPTGLDVYLIPASKSFSNLLATIEDIKPVGNTPVTISIPPGDFVAAYVRPGFERERELHSYGFYVKGRPGWRIAGKEVEDGIYQRHAGEDALFARSNGAGREYVEELHGPSIGGVQTTLPLIEDGSDWMAIEISKTEVLRVCRAYALTKKDQPLVHSAVFGTHQQMRDSKPAPLRGDGRVLSMSREEISSVYEFFGSNAEMAREALDALLETGAFFLPKTNRKWAGKDSPALSPKGEYSIVLRFGEDERGNLKVHANCLNPRESYMYVSRYSKPDSRHFWPIGKCDTLSLSPKSDKLLWSIDEAKEVWCVDLAEKRVDFVLSNWPGTSMLEGIRRADWAAQYWLLHLRSDQLVVWDRTKHETVYAAERFKNAAYSVSQETLLVLREDNALVSVDAGTWDTPVTNRLDVGFDISDIVPRVADDHVALLGDKGQYALLDTETCEVKGSGRVPCDRVLDVCQFDLGLRLAVRKDHETVTAWEVRATDPRNPVLVTSLSARNVDDATVRGDILVLENDPAQCYRIGDGTTERIGWTDKKGTGVYALAPDGSRLACALENQTVRITATRSPGEDLLVGAPLPVNPVSVTNGMALTVSPGTKSWFRQSIPSDKRIVARSVSGTFTMDGPEGLEADYDDFTWKDAKLWHEFILLPGEKVTNGAKLSFTYDFHVNADDSFDLEGVNVYRLQLNMDAADR